jgi:hypothetical protein
MHRIRDHSRLQQELVRAMLTGNQDPPLAPDVALLLPIQDLHGGNTAGPGWSM